MAPLLDWPATAAPAELAPTEAHVWVWPLDPLPADLAPLVALLDDAEQQRMQRFYFAPDRARYAVAHGILRRILGAYLDRPAETLAFRAGNFGKPELVADGLPASLSFNLSHTRTVAALAVVRSGPVGVDIEEVRPIEPEVAASHFSPAELAQLNRLQGDDWLKAFYRCWTRKEAILKAEGVGLQRALDGFDVSLAPEAPAALLQTRVPFSHPWTLYDVSPAPLTAGALATAHPCSHVARYRFAG